MKVANIFRKIFGHTVDKTQTAQQTVQVKFEQPQSEYDKMKGCVFNLMMKLRKKNQ